MNTQKVTFVKSAADKKAFLPNDRPGVVFAGRSNVGKSSVINCLLQRKNFARVGSTPGKTVAFDGGTVAENALKDRYVLINGVKAKVTANTASTVTLDTNVTCADNAVIYPGEGASGGGAAFSTLVIGKDAYGVTEVEGGGLEMIVKPFGAGEDALNQRCTAGWKATAAAEILSPEYMVRIESCSPKFGARAAAN